MAAAIVALIDTGPPGSLWVSSLADLALIIIYIHIPVKNDYCTDGHLRESMFFSGYMLAIISHLHVANNVNETNL